MTTPMRNPGLDSQARLMYTLRRRRLAASVLALDGGQVAKPLGAIERKTPPIALQEFPKKETNDERPITTHSV